VTQSVQKFRIIVLALLVSNRIKYWSNYSIRNFEYSHSTRQKASWDVMWMLISTVSCLLSFSLLASVMIRNSTWCGGDVN